MGRILAIDYGKKRVGIAVSDPLKLIAIPLKTINTIDSLRFLKTYMQQEDVDTLVIGVPKKLNNTSSPMTVTVIKFIEKLQANFPDTYIVTQDERFSSKFALISMIEAGFKKKDRRDKANLDKISAAIILQSFLTRHYSQTEL